MPIRILLLGFPFLFLTCTSELSEIDYTQSSAVSESILGLQDSVTTLAQAAEKLCAQKVSYDPSYFTIPYPNGDIPKGLGVCTDVIIRAYRSLNIDLQQLVHEDMLDHFAEYPNNWGLSKPDPNIDHRRVPNLMTFFERQGASVKTVNEEYLPGDVLAWNLGGAITHIGILSSKANEDGQYWVVHNIGAGQVLEDVLFDYKIIGHYRWKSKP